MQTKNLPNPNLVLVENEILVSLCTKCSCCLALYSHCYTCHTTSSIKSLCGCGECDSKAQAFADRETERLSRRRVNLMGKAILKDLNNA